MHVICATVRKGFTHCKKYSRGSCTLALVALSALRAGQIDARENQRQFLSRELHALAIATRLWSGERPFFQPLVPDGQAATLVVQHLHTISPLAGEDEQMPGQRIVF
jgi:hypothetical protein